MTKSASTPVAGSGTPGLLSLTRSGFGLDGGVLDPLLADPSRWAKDNGLTESWPRRAAHHIQRPLGCIKIAAALIESLARIAVNDFQFAIVRVSSVSANRSPENSVNGWRTRRHREYFRTKRRG